MIKTFTFVKMNIGLSRDDFFLRWCQHARDFDLRNQPGIEFSRLMLIDGEGPYVGIAEQHWQDSASLEGFQRWYETPAGTVYRKTLESFVDLSNSPSFIVTHEAGVSLDHGVEVVSGPSEISFD